MGSRQVPRAASCFGWQNCPSCCLVLTGQCCWGRETGEGRECPHAQVGQQCLGFLSPAVDHSDTLGEGKNFCKCMGASRWSAMVYEPTHPENLCPHCSPSEQYPSAWCLPLPFPLLHSLPFLPPCNPPGRPPALGKVQGLGPSVPVAVWAAGAELCPLQEGRAVSASCLLSSVEAAGHRWSLSVRAVISFGALKTALNEDVAA